MAGQKNLVLRGQSLQDGNALECHRLQSEQGVITIGRVEGNDVRIVNSSVSGRHAKLEFREEGCVWLCDIGSSNGTFVDKEPPPGTRIPEEGVTLNLGDYIRFGFSPIVYRLEQDEENDSDTVGGNLEASMSSPEKRQARLRRAEEAYLARLSEVREEYAEQRRRAEEEGQARLAEDPSLQFLLELCPSHFSFQNTVSLAATSDSEEEPLLDPEILSAELERLSGRSWEVASVLRTGSSFASDEDIETVEGSLISVLQFLAEDLPQAADSLGIIRGRVFQALLSRSGRVLPGHVERQREGAADITALNGKTMETLLTGAEDLSSLLRVKIEDDGDLALARMVVEDCQRFFSDLRQCARAKGCGIWEMFREVHN